MAGVVDESPTGGRWYLDPRSVRPCGVSPVAGCEWTARKHTLLSGPPLLVTVAALLSALAGVVLPGPFWLIAVPVTLPLVWRPVSPSR